MEVVVSRVHTTALQPGWQSETVSQNKTFFFKEQSNTFRDNIVSEVQILLDGMNNSLDSAKEKISELKIQQQKQSKLKHREEKIMNEQSISDLWDKISY